MIRIRIRDAHPDPDVKTSSRFFFSSKNVQSTRPVRNLLYFFIYKGTTGVLLAEQMREDPEATKIIYSALFF
jgi:hypothetical protein